MKRDDERAVNARTSDLLELAQSIGEVADETGGWPATTHGQSVTGPDMVRRQN